MGSSPAWCRSTLRTMGGVVAWSGDGWQGWVVGILFFVLQCNKYALIIWAHGVVVSHPLCMRKALGSIPSVSISLILLGLCEV